MDIDIAALADQLMPYLTAATGAYGAAVAAKTQDVVADETVGLGRRLVRRLLTRERSRPQIEAALDDLARSRNDADADDATAALRLQVKKALAADPALAAELAGMLPGVTVSGGITAVGERAAAVGVNAGVMQFGDNSIARR